MKSIDAIKNRLIDRILATRNEKLLEAMESIFTSTQKEEETVSLNSEQIEMLVMSEQDIKYGKLISETEVDKLDSKWPG